MFGLPDARRIRRADLYTEGSSSSSSPSPSLSLSEPSPSPSTQLHSHLARVYGPVFKPISLSKSASNVKGAENAVEAVEDGFEFRLFSRSDKTAGGTEGNGYGITRIILGDDDGEGGFTVPRRDERYYFAEPACAAQKARFEFAAVSGEEVRRYQLVRYTGWEAPWRVQVWKQQQGVGRRTGDGGMKGDASAGGEEVTLGERRQKKKKPGKKRRIAMRMRKRAEEEEEERRRREVQRREEAEREKRMRRNREKKVKRKAREKAKKAGVVPSEDGIMGSMAPS